MQQQAGRESTRIPFSDSDERFQFQMDDEGWFRIVAPDGTPSHPVAYNGVATLKYEGEYFFAVSDYYTPVFRAEVVYKTESAFTDSVRVGQFESEEAE